MSLAKATSNSTKGPFVTLLIPLFDPESRANGHGKLTERLALVLIRLLRAENPLVVTIPAVHGLVGGREAFVTGRRADVFNGFQFGHFLLVEFGRGGCKNLKYYQMIVKLK